MLLITLKNNMTNKVVKRLKKIATAISGIIPGKSSMRRIKKDYTRGKIRIKTKKI